MQRQCQTCPNLLPEDSAINKKFCFDCKRKRMVDCSRKYYELRTSRKAPIASYLSKRDRTLLELARKYRNRLNKFVREEKKKKEGGEKYLTERMGDILEHRVAGDMTLEQLGAKWKITRERVRQLEKIARKLTDNDAWRDRKCKYCQRDYLPSWRTQKYCNPVCAKLWQKEHPRVLTEEQKLAYREAYKKKRQATAFKWRVEVVCANPGCGKVFVKQQKNQKYCGSYSEKIGCSYGLQRHNNKPYLLPKTCVVCGEEIVWKQHSKKIMRNHKYCDTHRMVMDKISTKTSWDGFTRKEIAEALKELILPVQEKMETIN